MKVAVAFCAFFLVVSASNLSKHKVRLVDVVGNNFLFRGNLPLNSTDHFDLPTLVKYMSERAKEENHTLPTHFDLTDISFLSPYLPKERPHLEIEKKFFEDNPHVGSLWHWPLVGDPVSPSIIPKIVRTRLAANLPSWQIDQVPTLMKGVRSLLTAKYPTPLVIYYHCEAGSDRTGEFSASYYMQWKNITLEQAIAIDEEVAGREIASLSLWASEWYCWYLKEALGYPLTCKLK